MRQFVKYIQLGLHVEVKPDRFAVTQPLGFITGWHVVGRRGSPVRSTFGPPREAAMLAETGKCLVGVTGDIGCKSDFRAWRHDPVQ